MEHISFTRCRVAKGNGEFFERMNKIVQKQDSLLAANQAEVSMAVLSSTPQPHTGSYYSEAYLRRVLYNVLAERLGWPAFEFTQRVITFNYL